MNHPLFSLRVWLAVLCFLPGCAWAQDPFPGNTAPVLTFKETYQEVIRRAPDSDPTDPDDVTVVPQRMVKITVKAPLTGFDLTSINEDTPYSLTVGNFVSDEVEGLSGYLTDDETWDPDQTVAVPDHSVSFPIFGTNYDGDSVVIGSMTLDWNAQEVVCQVNINTIKNPFYEWGLSESVLAEDFLGSDDDAILEDSTAAFSFGPFSFDLSSLLVAGTASVKEDSGLASVTLDGAVDSVPPTLTITSPAPKKTKIDEVDGVSSDLLFTLAGTSADIRRVSSSSYPGTVEMVEVRLGVPGNEGGFTDEGVELLENGDWTVPDAQLQPGENHLTFRATDSQGNTFTTPLRTVIVSVKGALTFYADAQTGYPDNQTGNGAGTVLITGPGPFSGQLLAVINDVPDSLVVADVPAGLICTVVAKAAAGSAFAGWEGRVAGAVVFTSADEKYAFEAKPFLEVTAKFLPNPFTAATTGAYQGLVTGDSAAERGLFKVSIGKTGAMTGKVQVGPLTLPIKGRILGNGKWFGIVKKGGKAYTVKFTVMTGADEERFLEGTVTGGGVEAEFAAELTGWHKAKKGIVEKLVPAEQIGTFNVHLLPFAGNTDGNFPQGIGYGRVTISKLGVVSFVGRLGDGSGVSATSTLVQRKDGTTFFPFFLPLDKKLGNVAGLVILASLAESDFTGTLDWAEPPTSGVNPLAFAGLISLTGARYQEVLPGERVLLQGVDGAGTLSFDAPPFTKPAKGDILGKHDDYDVTLDATQTILASSDRTGRLAALNFKLKFNPKTGLFSGSYQDPTLQQTVKLRGAVIQAANGGAGFAAGVFQRGNEAGAVTFGPRNP